MDFEEQQDIKKFDDLTERFMNYNKDKKLKKVVEAWENGTSDVFFEHSEFKHDLKLGATWDGMPMFQWLLEMKRIKPLHETTHHIAFIPAGFDKDKNDQLSKGDRLSEGQLESLGRINPVQYRLGGSAALMSLLHVLVIPKLDYMRVFNAVTLPGKDYDFADAIQCGETALNILKEGAAEQVGSLRFWLNQEDKLAVREADLSAEKGTVLPSTAENHTMNIKHSFHVYGNNSIGYLHMHVYDGKLLTKAYDKMDGDNKNTPVHVVQPWVNWMEDNWVDEEEPKPEPLSDVPPPRYIRTVPYPLSVQPTYELPPASKPKANTHPRFNNLRH
jgi:hypothetical protein